METFQSIATDHITALGPGFDPGHPDAQTRAYRMIEYAKGRYDWYQEQREKKLSLGLALATLSGVTATILVSSVNGRGLISGSFQFNIVALLLAVLAITAIAVIAVYLKGQSSNYTHRRGLVGIVSWYHYGVPIDTEVSPAEALIWGQYSTLLSADGDPARNRKLARLSSGFKEFSAAALKRMADPSQALAEDLQQVYILQSLQVLARSNLKLMIGLLKTGGLCVAVLTMMLILSILHSGLSVTAS